MANGGLSLYKAVGVLKEALNKFELGEYSEGIVKRVLKEYCERVGMNFSEGMIEQMVKQPVDMSELKLPDTSVDVEIFKEAVRECLYSIFNLPEEKVLEVLEYISKALGG